MILANKNNLPTYLLGKLNRTTFSSLSSRVWKKVNNHVYPCVCLNVHSLQPLHRFGPNLEVWLSKTRESAQLYRFNQRMHVTSTIVSIVPALMVSIPAFVCFFCLPNPTFFAGSSAKSDAHRKPGVFAFSPKNPCESYFIQKLLLKQLF